MNERQLNFFGTETDSRSSSRRQIIALPIDTLALLGIIVVLLLTISFSLGVERGKKITLNPAVTPEVIAKKAEAKTEFPQQTQQNILNPQPGQSISADDPYAVETVQKPQPAVTQVASISSNSRYRIQVASYKKENEAWQEARMLKNKGYSATVDKKGNFAVIIVGDFSNKTDAQKNMQSLKTKYRDCFIRRL